jgi:hypothetical protein
MVGPSRRYGGWPRVPLPPRRVGRAARTAQAPVRPAELGAGVHEPPPRLQGGHSVDRRARIFVVKARPTAAPALARVFARAPAWPPGETAGGASRGAARSGLEGATSTSHSSYVGGQKFVDSSIPGAGVKRLLAAQLEQLLLVLQREQTDQALEVLQGAARPMPLDVIPG